MPQDGATAQKSGQKSGQKSDRVLASKSAVTIDEEYKMVRDFSFAQHTCFRTSGLRGMRDDDIPVRLA